MAIVLFASNMMVPLTAGSFLLILKHAKLSTNKLKGGQFKFNRIESTLGNKLHQSIFSQVEDHPQSRFIELHEKYLLIFHSPCRWVQDHPPVVPFPQLFK